MMTYINNINYINLLDDQILVIENYSVIYVFLYIKNFRLVIFSKFLGSFL